MERELTLVSSSDLPPNTYEVRRVDSQLKRLSRQTLGAAGLYERRPELRGVSTWSEAVVESVLWSA